MLLFLFVVFVVVVALNGDGTFSLHVRVCLRFRVSPFSPALLRCSGLLSVVVAGFVVLFVVVVLVCF